MAFDCLAKLVLQVFLFGLKNRGPSFRLVRFGLEVFSRPCGEAGEVGNTLADAWCFHGPRPPHQTPPQVRNNKPAIRLLRADADGEPDE